MGSHYGAVNDEMLYVWVLSKVMMHPFPNTSITPAGEPFVDRVPVAIGFWQRSPLGDAAGHPEDGFNETAAFPLVAHVDLRAGA